MSKKMLIAISIIILIFLPPNTPSIYAQENKDGTVQPITLENANQLTPIVLLKGAKSDDVIISHLAFSEDGKKVMAMDEGVYGTPMMWVWDVETGAKLREDAIRFGVFALGASSGPRLVSHRNGELEITDAFTGESAATLKLDRQSGTLLRARFSQDGTWLVVCWLAEANTCEAEVWEVNSNTLLFSHIVHSEIRMSADGRFLADFWFQEFTMWDVDTGQETRPDLGYGAYVFSPDGSLLVFAESPETGVNLTLLDLETGQRRGTDRATTGAQAAAVEDILFSPDQQWMAWSTTRGTLRVLNAKTGALQSVMQGHSTNVKEIIFAPDSSWLASVGDEALWIWNTKTGQLVSKFLAHDDPTGALTVSADSTLLATANMWSADVWVWGIPGEDATVQRDGVTLTGGARTGLTVKVPGDWIADGLPRYEIKFDEAMVNLITCPYTGNHYLVRQQAIVTVTITDLSTNQKVASQRFPGLLGQNIYACPSTYSFGASSTIYEEISAPDREGFGAWLMQIMRFRMAQDEGQVVGWVNNAVNLREGPGKDFDVVGVLNPGEGMLLLGRNEPGDWLYVRTFADEPLKAWVAAFLVTTEVQIDTLSIVDDVAQSLSSEDSTPSPEPTRVPVNTPTPTLKPTEIVAFELTYETTIKSTMAGTSATVVYTFEGQAEDIVNIIATAEDDRRLDLALDLIGPGGAIVASNDDHDRFNPAIIGQVLSVAGQYTIIVKSVEGKGTFSLELERAKVLNPGEILFSETFDNNDSYWETASADYVVSELRDGAYVIEWMSDPGYTWVVAPGFEHPSAAPVFTVPYEIEVEVSDIFSRSGKYWICVVFDVKESYEGWHEIGFYDGGTWALFSTSRDEIVDYGLVDSIDFLDGNTHTMTVRVLADGIQFLIDGELVADRTVELDWHSGSVGFGIGSHPDDSGKIFIEAHFDNLVVRELVEE